MSLTHASPGQQHALRSPAIKQANPPPSSGRGLACLSDCSPVVLGDEWVEANCWLRANEYIRQGKGQKERFVTDSGSMIEKLPIHRGDAAGDALMFLSQEGSSALHLVV